MVEPCWTNPFEKYDCQSNWIMSPSQGKNVYKWLNVSNHHLVMNRQKNSDGTWPLQISASRCIYSTPDCREKTYSRNGNGFFVRIISFLGGGFSHLKNISQIGNLPQIGVKIEKHLKPPPSFVYSYNFISHTIHRTYIFVSIWVILMVIHGSHRYWKTSKTA